MWWEGGVDCADSALVFACNWAGFIVMPGQQPTGPGYCVPADARALKLLINSIIIGWDLFCLSQSKSVTSFPVNLVIFGQLIG